MKKKKYLKKVRNSSLKFTFKGNTRGILFFLSIISLLLFIITAYSWGKKKYDNYVKFFIEFDPVFAPGDNIGEYVDLDLNNSFNLLFVGLDSKKSGHIKADAVILIHFDPADQIFQVISLPCKAYYYVPDLGDYFQLENAYAIGQLETPERGMELLLSTLENDLALSVDGYMAMNIQQLAAVLENLGNIVIQNEQEFTDTDLSNLGLKATFSEGRLKLNSGELLAYIMADEGGFLAQSKRHYSVLNSLKLILNKSLIFKFLDQFDVHSNIFSNISGESLKRIMNFVIENKDNIKLYYADLIAEDRIINDKSLPVFNESRFDQRISEIFLNQDVKLEQARIEVYNGTSSYGLAGRYSRFITNFGGDVTRVSSKLGDYNETIIFTKDIDQYLNTLRNLGFIFTNAQIVEGLPDFSVTGDIIILIGADSEM